MIAKSVWQMCSRRPILPQIYQNQWRELKPAQDQIKGLERDSLLKIISWNINFNNPAPKKRVAKIMHYLQNTLGNNPTQLVILLQEVSQLSAQQIMQTKWVQDNFIVIGHEPPIIFQAGIPRQASYYTMAMTPRSLRLQNSFRMPLPSEMGRDAIFADLHLCSSKKSPNCAKEVFRVSTTHLESLQEGISLRAQQLELISQSLGGVENKVRIVAGLVGGDMNATHHSDFTLHSRVGLRDAWGDQSTKAARGDLPCNQVHGHTWGYQSTSIEFPPARLDKFLYSGCVKTTNLANTQGDEEMIMRLGVGLTVDVSSKNPLQKLRPLGLERDLQKIWVSDHYGIAIGVKIPE